MKTAVITPYKGDGCEQEVSGYPIEMPDEQIKRDALKQCGLTRCKKFKVIYEIQAISNKHNKIL